MSRLAAGVLFLALLSSLPPLCAAEGKATAADNPESELQQVRKRIEHLVSDLASVTARYQALQKELEQSERRIGASGQRLHQLDRRMDRQQQRLDELQRQRQQQRSNLERQRDALAGQIRAAYAMGRQQRLKILLNQQDPAIVSRVLVYYDYLNRARAAKMQHIRSMLDELRQTERDIASQNEQLRALRMTEQEEQQRFAESRSQRQQVLDALDKDLQTKGGRLKALKQDEQQLQALIRKLQESIDDLPLVAADKKPLKALKGRLRWPAKGQLMTRFGSPKAGNLRWDGVVIAAPEGREVKAVHRGRVAFADWLRGYGLLLIIDHGDGYMTLYGNNQSLFKETGEWVEAGEAVALVGSSGGRRDPGIYFGIRVKGKAVNPRKWCRRIKGNRVSWRWNGAAGYGSKRKGWPAGQNAALTAAMDAVSIT